MQALILAAGMGKRLGQYTKDATKCMVPVNGKTLIEYSIEALLEAGITKLILVIGYRGEKLREFLDGKYPQMTIHYIENPIYDKTNNIYSLYLAAKELAQDDTLLLESDLIFEADILKELTAAPEPNLAVVSHFEGWMDGTVTLINAENEIVGVLDKTKFNWNDIDTYYKTVNIYKFSKGFSANYYVPFLEAYQKAFGKNEYYEQVLKVLSFLDSTTLKGFPVAGSRWYEIDDPADLAVAETRFAAPERKLQLMQSRYGGYWRFPAMLDYCYLVNPYFPPEQLIRELQSNLSQLLTQYPSGDKQQSLLAGKIFGIAPEHIAVGNGAAELIAALGEKITGKIAIPYPTFNEYPERFINAKTVPVPVAADFSYTATDILSAVDRENANSVLLINPDNPSGNFLGKQAVLELLDELNKRSVTLYFDESFIDFAEPELRYTLLDETILVKYPNLVVIKSVSKSYGVPGLRLGILASVNPEYVRIIQKKTAIWNINSFAEYYLQIYDKYKKTYAEACNAISQERARFVHGLSALSDIKVYPSQANYVLCKLQSKLTAKTLAEKLLDADNIFIKDLSSKKGFEHGQFIRFAVRNTHDNDRLLAALAKYLQ